MNSPPDDMQLLGAKGTKGAISAAFLEALRDNFRKDPKNVALMNALAGNDLESLLVNRKLKLDTYHVFSDKIELEGKATNQKSTGRCWIFAGLNVMRIPLMKRNKMEDFEFSQSYLFWFDKLEKSNWFLESIITSCLSSPNDDRLLHHLLKDPVQDGGQWDMLVNLVEKYGLVPKAVFPECFHTSNSRALNRMLTSKLRANASLLRLKYSEGVIIDQLRELKDTMMSEVKTILTMLLGEPPVSFDWSFVDKDKKFQSFKSLTPKQFFADFVSYSIGETVSLINDPRNPYYKLYTVANLGNVVAGRPVLYVNVPIETLKSHAIAAIKASKPVWFGCDIGHQFGRKPGVMDYELYDYSSPFNVKFDMTKADRLHYGQSAMSHAMVFTGVNLESDLPVRWRVENSWGDEGGDKGYFSMSDNWFNEYMYQVVVEKAALDTELLPVLEQEPIVLAPWDPMGTLA